MVELNQVQKADAENIWQSHWRHLVDIQPNSGNLPPPINGSTMSFITRFYSFFRSFLRHNTTNQSEEQYVRKGSSSSLGAFLELVIDNNHNLRVGLGGRLVFHVHHSEFLDELEHFELRGSTMTDSYRNNSFGAFLYHFPCQALFALATGLGTALVSIARKTPIPVDNLIHGCQWIARFNHVTPKNNMIDIKTGLAYKFLSIKGHVVKARPKRLRVVSADFSCPKCSATLTHSFQDGKYSFPTKCITQNCRSRSFTVQRNTGRYINVQELRLQEAQEESTSHAGRTPRQMEVLLEHELVDLCRPGDVVMVAGTVQAINSAVAAGKMGKRALETSTYKLYILAHSITTMSERRDQNQNRKREQEGTAVYTQQQLQSITQLCHADHRYLGMMERRAFPFDLLVRSLCPSIIGHEMVKAGIVLCLLGGTTSTTADRGNQIRSNSHILIVGDPGMGKSQMLLAATQVASRSVFVGGNTASTTGLTVSLTKEAGGETGIEAGALVLADQGICCLDEFDKMAKSHQDGLLEAMEQQQISIAKAGVVASLPARCSVLAAANPKHGSYNMSKSVAENLNMATPILSRFDLVFILRDRADKYQDHMVATNIMNLHRREKSGSSTGRRDVSSSLQHNPQKRLALKDRLEWVAQFQKQPLPADLVRDYIAYAREHCKPKLSQEAAVVLKEYFMTLRHPTDGRNRRDSVPITTRQLEAMIRLSQARAKACLREYVLEEDALDIVELMTSSVEEIHKDAEGNMDRSRGGAGGKSKRKIKKAFVNEVYRIIGSGSECTEEDLRRIAVKVNCGLGDFAGMVEDIRDEGILMRTPSGGYRVVS